MVGCSVWEEDQQRWYRKYNDSKYAPALNLAGFTINHADTYMSGYIFRVEQLKSLDLKTLCGLPGPAHCRNVYGHIDIAQQLLTEGSFLTYGENLVVKGAQISEGGHAFSHRVSGESARHDNLDLNPEVYGPYARTCQYFYREFLLQDLKPYFSPLAFIAAEANLFLFFYQATVQSSNVVRIEPDRSVGTEAARAIEDSLSAGFVSGSTNSHLFIDSARSSGEGALAGAALMQGILKSLLEKPMMEQMRY